jgi:hypothetical protein
LIPDSGGIQNIFFEQASRQLLITADNNLLNYDVDNETCTVSNGSISMFDILMTGGGQVLGTYFNQLVRIDTASGEQVIISK